MRVLLAHSDDRRFEIERFTAAWTGAGGAADELLPVSPAAAGAVPAGLGGVSGVILSGGPDVEPARYGSAPLPGVELACQPERDALDLGLLDGAAAARLPVLAICYGCQVLQVWRGGTLIQDLPAAGFPGHQERVDGHLDRPAHTVAVDRSSRLIGWMEPTVAVNSRHHQGLTAAGAGLRVAAVAPDGIVEALEGEDPAHWLLGVQWHPENMPTDPHRELFRRFRQACEIRSDGA